MIFRSWVLYFFTLAASLTVLTAVSFDPITCISSQRNSSGLWSKYSVHENHRTCQTFPMARPKCLMRDFTNLNRIYKAHRTNVWWTMKVFRLHWNTMNQWINRSMCHAETRSGQLNCRSASLKKMSLIFGLPYMFCIKFHSPRPIFYFRPSKKFTHTGERANFNSPHCQGCQK